MTPVPLFAGEGRFYLLYYHAPIGFAFVTYAFDRAEHWSEIKWQQWMVEVPVLALALSRALVAIPFFSGHALFLVYALLTLSSRLARWITIIVLVDVIYIKATLQDLTLFGGIALGLLAAWLVNQMGHRQLTLSE